MLCNILVGGQEGGVGVAQEEGAIHIHIADSCCMAETNTSM